MVEVTGYDGITYSYHLEPKMRLFLDKNVKSLINKKDKDYVMLIDGYEGSGKSTFAMQIGKYVDPNLDLSRVCLKADEFRQAVLNAKKGQCVIYDEAVTGMTAGESITKVGKLLKSLMMQMRQKNLFVIVIMPSIFEFNKYAVLSRARSFFHIYEKGQRMGYWVGYNKKDTRKLYLLGKKTHSYKVRSFFNGRFYGKTVVDEAAYRAKKEKCLEEADVVDTGDNKYAYQRNYLIQYLRDEGKTGADIVRILEGCRYPLKSTMIYEILGKSPEFFARIAIPGK